MNKRLYSELQTKL